MTRTLRPEHAPKVAPRAGLVVMALGAVYVVWGSTYLGIRIMVEEAPPLTSGGLRFMTAGILLGAVLALRGGLRRLAVTPRQLAGAAFLGLMLPMLGNGLVSVGENMGAPSGVTALLIAVVPLWIVVFRTVGGDRPGPLSLLGVLLGFAGLAYLVLAGHGAEGAISLPAAALILFASTCWSVGSFVQPRLWLPQDVFVTTVYEMICGGTIMVLVGLVAGERFTGDYSARTWLAFGYLVVFGSMVAFTSYVWLLSNAPISLVATYAYVNPVVAVFLGWLILAEPVTGPIVIGGGVVVLAVAIVITAERPRRKPLPDTPVPEDVAARA
ncbi:EamA family transporter [Nocardioides sp. WL0053]|uniref:EamA family transporter n=1 Tax=Nocardioides jiangsuensis TaxID=2866161 RepID=A0ABS7RG43_9ACTN|nr:EamA family transporter [Nocardioides jiangsuensis]MBY9074008.1 EamA family transporter [Nocardioides jiangsuensis]